MGMRVEMLGGGRSVYSLRRRRKIVLVTGPTESPQSGVAGIELLAAQRPERDRVLFPTNHGVAGQQ